MIAAIVAALGVLALAAGLGWLLTRRAGAVRASDPESTREVDTTDLGLSGTGPTLVHFSATWCGPCARVRQVIDQVSEDLGGYGRQSGCRAAAFGAVVTHHVHLRCRRAPAIPSVGCAQSWRLTLSAVRAVGLTTEAMGKLIDVSTRLELLLTKRRTVDLCRIAGCCCCCSR
jgi:hypothetical protein